MSMHEAFILSRDDAADAAQDEKESAGPADIKITVTVTVATSVRLQGIAFADMQCLLRDVLFSCSEGIFAAAKQVILSMMSSANFSKHLLSRIVNEA
mmetsp:Transcript_27059/g.64221  ORF Transcript_27059/g.64221 Transcript_27059/m.64221 type:complete len:97 (+) Transcript_27059:715-1005(+)